MSCERNQEATAAATITIGCWKDIFVLIFWKAVHNPLNV
jgi:hypothetical protein